MGEERWFRLHPQGPRFATARRVLAEGTESIRTFYASGLTELGWLGPINWQLPPTEIPDPADVAAFLDLLPDRLEDLSPAMPSRPAARQFRLRRVHRAPARPQHCRHPGRRQRLSPDRRGYAHFAYLRIMGAAKPSRSAIPKPTSTAGPPACATWPPRGGLPFVISGHKAANPAAATALIQRL